MLGRRKLASSTQALLLVSLALHLTTSNGLQFCGNDLSNAIAIVCSETGYNMPQQSYDISSYAADYGSEQRYTRDVSGRTKRGIVDECCRASCGWATIETYCRPPSTTTTSENLQIQKRSDPPSEAAFREQVEEYGMTRADPGEGYRHQKRRLFSQAEDAVVIKNNRVFHSVGSGVHDLAITSNKVKRNDKHRHQNAPDKMQLLQIRHRANKLHHKDIKTKKSQVGTIAPYYLGKFLVSPKARRLSF